jgi:hypothetical protein
MGKKPLIALAGLCLAGVALCGCQQDRQYAGPWRKNNATKPNPTPPPDGGLGATGWNSTPSRDLTSRPGSTDLGGSNAGLASGSGLGSGMGSGGSAPGSSGFGNGMRQTSGGMMGNAGANGMSSSPGLGGSSAWGQNATPMGGATGLGRSSGLPGGESRLAEPPPASGSLTGSPSGSALGGMAAGGSGSLVTPPPAPAAARPMPSGAMNLGGEAPPGAPAPMNQSNFSGGYRTVPSALGDPGAPPPAVPTMSSNHLDQ